jgi:hypothetical protein
LPGTWNIGRGFDKASVFCNSNGDHKSRQAGPAPLAENSAVLAGEEAAARRSAPQGAL